MSDFDREIERLELAALNSGSMQDIEAVEAMYQRIDPLHVVYSLLIPADAPSYGGFEIPVRRIVAQYPNGYRRVFDAWRVNKPHELGRDPAALISIMGMGSASAGTSRFGRGAGRGSGSINVHAGDPGRPDTRGLWLQYGKDHLKLKSVVVVPPTFALPRKKSSVSKEMKPVRLGTKRSRAIFAQAVSASGYHYDDMSRGDAHYEPDLDYVRRPDGLEAHAIRRGVKSLAVRGAPGPHGIPYSVHYHGNSWVDFVSPAESRAAQHAEEWEPEEYAPAAFVPPPPSAPVVEEWEPEEYGVVVGAPAPPAPLSERPRFLVVNTQTEEVLGAYHDSSEAVKAMLALPDGPWGVADDLMLWRRLPVASDPREELVEGPAPGFSPIVHEGGAHVGRSDYEERKQRRVEAMRRSARKWSSRAEEEYRRADLREEHSGIPFGQPILVGHHSEKHHRKAIERADAAMRRSIEADEHARMAEATLRRMERAEATGSGPISSDDPRAVERLREKIGQLERSRDRMKQVNDLIRQAARSAGVDLKRLGLRGSGPSHDKAQEVLSAAVAAGVTEGEAAQLSRSFALAPYHGLGYPAYAFTNTGAEIRRAQKRIEDLQRVASTAGQLSFYGQVGGGHDAPEASPAVEGFSVVEEDNRIRFLFQGKPGAQTRATLKASGFKWAPTVGAWQRILTENARAAAARVVSTINSHGGWRSNPGRVR